MAHKPTITIGIPAFNEQANIGYLLRELITQQFSVAELTQVIVALDGCTDNTLAEVKQVGDPRITIINNTTREGVAKRQNQIIEQTQSDILILINADVQITDQRCLEKLVTPIITDKADMTAPRITPLTPTTFFESIIFASVTLKWAIFEKINNGNSIYTCSGLTRVFSQRAYQNLRFSHSIGEDAYSYVFAKIHGFTYQYIKSTTVFYRLPSNFRDHARQSTRFFTSRDLYKGQFASVDMRSYYGIPKAIGLRVLAHYATRYPLHLFLYAGIVCYLRCKAMVKSQTEQTWHIAESSKLVRNIS